MHLTYIDWVSLDIQSDIDVLLALDYIMVNSSVEEEIPCNVWFTFRIVRISQRDGFSILIDGRIRNHISIWIFQLNCIWNRKSYFSRKSNRCRITLIYRIIG